MAKKCKNCWGQTPPPHLNKFCCMDCHVKGWGTFLKQTPLKPCTVKIKAVSSTNKNKPAKFTQKIKDKILARDKVCIISGNPIEEYHHVYFGINANRGENRNDLDQWVGLSAEIHRIIHHASPKEVHLSKIYRAKCIIHVKK